MYYEDGNIGANRYCLVPFNFSYALNLLYTNTQSMTNIAFAWQTFFIRKMNS